MNVLLVIVGLVAAVSAKDIVVGHEGGKLIFEQNVTASPAIWRQERNLTINASDYEVITRVVVIDNREDKNGEAAVVEGGEGFKNVTVNLKSPAVFRGYDFEVKVYAKSEDGNQKPVNDDQQNVQSSIGHNTNLEDQQQVQNSFGQNTNLNDQQQVQSSVGQNTNLEDQQQVQSSFGKNTNLEDQQQVQKSFGQDTNVNDKQAPKQDSDEVIKGLVTPVPTSSTTHVPDTQEKEQHPVVTGKDEEQLRPNRDTKDQVSTQKPIESTPVEKVQPAQSDEKADETQKTQGFNQKDWQATIDEIFSDVNSSKQTTEATKPTHNFGDFDQSSIDINGSGDAQVTEQNDELIPLEVVPMSPGKEGQQEQKPVEIQQETQQVQQQFKGVPLPYVNH